MEFNVQLLISSASIRPCTNKGLFRILRSIVTHSVWQFAFLGRPQNIFPTRPRTRICRISLRSSFRVQEANTRANTERGTYSGTKPSISCSSFLPLGFLSWIKQHFSAITLFFTFLSFSCHLFYQ